MNSGIESRPKAKSFQRRDLMTQSSIKSLGREASKWGTGRQERWELMSLEKAGKASLRAGILTSTSPGPVRSQPALQELSGG